MTRPTTAQLTVASDLLALAVKADQVHRIAVTIQDSDTLTEIITASRALVPLVDHSEAWIDPARAHIAVSVSLIAAIERRGEQR